MSGGLGTVTVVGTGAAGAFFALELGLRRPDVRIKLYDRPGGGPGAGIVMSRGFAEEVRARHPSAFAFDGTALATWDRTRTVIGDDQVWSGAYGMFGLRRRVFNDNVRTLAAARPGVRLHQETVTEVPHDTDLVVLADGANSRLRGDRFGTRVDAGRTRFLWLSTPTVVEPSFIIRPMGHGPLIVHSYPHCAEESTFIVEADPATLAAHELSGRPVSEVEKAIAEIFRAELDGAALHAQTADWMPFRTVVNERWHDGRVVLIGDAAHTVHFSTGSGTALAIEDAACLAEALAAHPSVDDALVAYAATRRPVLAAAQAEATESAAWFETCARRERLRGCQTVFALRSRRQLNTYPRLRERDPEFVATAVEVLAGTPTDAHPSDLPITIGGLAIAGRIVRAVGDPLDSLEFVGRHGVVRCPLVHTAADAPRWALVSEGEHALVTELRAAGTAVVGMVAEGVPTTTDGVDFFAVGAARGGRITATAVADEVRYATGLPVVLISSDPLARDEIETLVLAGRIDMAACPC